MNNWKETTLREVCTKIGSGATPRGGGGSYQFSGISLIRSQNVLDYSFSEQGLAFIDERQANQLSNVVVKEEDVLINITGDSVARVCQVPNDILPARVNQHVSILRADKNSLIPRFLKYYLLNPTFKRFLLILANSGGTRNALTKGMLEDLAITLPDIAEQKAIASVLSSLDDKIQLLQNQNKTLENITQTIYKHWFIDFEFPFDKDGNPLPSETLAKGGYKSSGGNMVDSELGEIPEEWRVGELNECADHIKKSVIPASSPKVMFSHYSIPAFDQNQIIKEDGVNILSNKYEVTENSFLISKLNPQTPRVWTILEPEENSVCSTEFQVIKPKNIEYYSFIYSFLNSPVFSHKLASAAHGTSSSHQRVKPQDIIGVEVIFPDKILIKKFQSFVFPVIKKMVSNNSQIQTLSRLRDTLLPKLMSGEIRVK